ncbi:O-antigen ligase [Tardiphaga sp.]|uniref:O-antigen ligase family protein n=1 Tax=Tardiphaga sp. TaxID=1926292 RepID=UPI0025CFF309|nr:O-antigen ligase [Tardiphaga sp.]
MTISGPPYAPLPTASDLRRLRVRRARAIVGGIDVVEAMKSLTVVGALLLVWITFSPFPNLQNPDLKSIATGQLAMTYLAFAGLAGLAVLLSATDNWPALRSLCTPVTIAFCCWMAINIALSQQPSVSLQRFVLTMCATSLAVMVPLLPSSRAQLDLCLAAAAGSLLALCYLGLVLVPNLSIHGALDTVEPQLAGDWRGSFGHKNLAAPTMVILFYLGLYLMRGRTLVAGAAIAIASAVFLFNSGGKSASALCLIILLLAAIVSRSRNRLLNYVLCLLPVIAFNLVSVGSVVSDTLAGITKMLPFDVTFTGRTGIWEFALAGFSQNPVKGYGYAAFWDYPANRTTIEAGSEWAFDASHSHNGYLELALTIGLPGLILALLILVISPLRNFHTIQARGGDLRLARFFLTIWLFGIYLSTMETFLLDRQNPTWFMFVIAVAGLHFMSRFRVRA